MPANRWNHADNRHAWCYKRPESELVYTCVYGKRAVIKGLIWKSANRAEAMKVLNFRLQQHYAAERGEYISSIKATQGVFLEDAIKAFWEKYILPNLNKETSKHYKSVFKIYLAAKNLPLSDYDAIKLHLDELVELRKVGYYDKLRKKKILPVGASKLRKDMQRLRKFFTYCINEGWIGSNPINNNNIPKEAKKETLIFTSEEMDSLLKYPYRSPFMGLFVQFAHITAMRIQEVIDMTWNDVKSDHFIIHGKGSRDRIFPLFFASELFGIFEQLKALQYQKNYPERLFCWNNQQKPREAFNAAKDALGISKEKTFHCIRKTTITNWEMLGIPIEVRTKLAGNSVAVQYKNYIKNPDVDYYKKQLANAGFLERKLTKNTKTKIILLSN